MKKHTLIIAAFIAIIFTLTSCSQRYSSGERVGLITQFSRTGLIWKTWEGHLNVTQTGMNSSHEFDFSIDRNKESERQSVIKTLQNAASNGWKVKLIYHEVKGENLVYERGETNFFVDSVIVLSTDITKDILKSSETDPEYNSKNNINEQTKGHIIDTIYLVIYKK